VIHDYGKVHAFGRDRSIQNILDGDVHVEEKIDGSQFSFAKIGGVVRFRSRGQEVHPDQAGQFTAGCAAILERADRIPEGLIFRGEYLQRPRHNVLAYSRVPRGHVMVWDVEHPEAGLLHPEDRKAAAEAIDLEAVPVLAHGRFTGLLDLTDVMGSTSVLGGPIEGVVIKRGALRAKVVTEAFREIRSTPRPKPTGEDFLRDLGRHYATPARWAKAVQHLRDAGELKGTRADTGAIIRRVQEDTLEECGAEIRAAVFEAFRKKITGAMIEGLPDWYAEQIAKVE
jgi:hypothetical protein